MHPTSIEYSQLQKSSLWNAYLHIFWNQICFLFVNWTKEEVSTKMTVCESLRSFYSFKCSLLNSLSNGFHLAARKHFTNVPILLRLTLLHLLCNRDFPIAPMHLSDSSNGNKRDPFFLFWWRLIPPSNWYSRFWNLTILV